MAKKHIEEDRPRIELGDLAKDTITGLEGVVIGETQWLFGCRRLVLQPREVKEGKIPDPVSFDEDQCELVLRAEELKASKKPVGTKRTPTGGPAPAGEELRGRIR